MIRHEHIPYPMLILSSGVNVGNIDGAFSVVAADMDQDGDLDLVTAADDSGTIVWFENEIKSGNANFGSSVSLATETGVWKTVAVDLDEDGDPDLVATSGDGNRVVWFENRVQTVSTPSPAETEPPSSGTSSSSSSAGEDASAGEPRTSCDSDFFCFGRLLPGSLT